MNDNRFFTLEDPFSDVPFLSALSDELSILDLVLADLVGTVQVEIADELLKLSSSLNDNPEIVCLRYRCDWELVALLNSSSRPQEDDFGLGALTLVEVDETGGTF